MKKIIFMLMFSGTTLYTNAQKLTPAKVPTAVKIAFAKLHAATTAVSWELEAGNFEAGFKVGTIENSEVYTPSGIRIETESEIKVSELPATVSNYIKSNFNGTKILAAAKITKANGTILYEADIKGRELLFDANGNLVK